MGKKIFWYFAFPLFAISLVFIGCGGQKGETPQAISNYFPPEIKTLGAVRTTEVEIYEGQSLYEYIDGGAELYHLYNFIKMATASYQAAEKEVILDIYEFDSPLNAYGLYSRIRPETAELISLGTEAFKGSGTLDVVKDKYLVRITGYDPAEQTAHLIDGLARAISRDLPGETARPGGFSFFTKVEAIPATDIYYADSYFGHSFLNDVFCQNYALGPDTVTLFYCLDPSGEKYAKWLEATTASHQELPDMAGIPFDQGQAFFVPDEYFGSLLVGLKSGKLIGCINYSPEHKDFLVDWLRAM